MKAITFEELISWKKSRELVLLLYSVMKNNKDFGFKDQLLRSGVSVMNNIAEGFERYSRKEFRYFLFIAKGSCGEVRSMLYLAQDLNYVSKEQFKKFCSLTVEISKLLHSFIKKL